MSDLSTSGTHGDAELAVQTQAQVRSLTRLVEAEATRQSLTEEDGVALDQLHVDVARLPHSVRVARLNALGARPADLRLDLCGRPR